MKTRPSVEGTMRALRITSRRLGMLALALLFTTASGCGVQRAKQESAAKQPAGDSKTTTPATAKTQAQAVEPGKAPEGTKSKGPTTSVRLTQLGCVQFEPVWTQIHVGQSLSWRSDVKSAVTIHVSPGAFDKTEYVVRAGSSASTGPARKAGSYTIWTTPAACQRAPRGVQGAGPGVTVDESGKP